MGNPSAPTALGDSISGCNNNNTDLPFIHEYVAAIKHAGLPDPLTNRVQRLPPRQWQPDWGAIA